MAKPSSAIRIMLVDDHVLLRMGLAGMLQLDDAFTVVAEADNGPEALKLFAQHQPDVTLLDIRMPGQSGVETLRQILAKWPAARVIMLTTSELGDDIAQAVKAGACGYLSKKITRDELIGAIQKVHAGETFIPKDISRRLASHQSSPQLSDREREVLVLLPKGLSNPEIAQRLGISSFTVKNHLHTIFKKLQVEDRAEAVTAARQRGILKLEE
ncbi:MAG: response regulator transcription factor [Verrucomicrobiota bacterium]